MDGNRAVLLATVLLLFHCYHYGYTAPSLRIPRYRVTDQEVIHLKHGKLHPHQDVRPELDEDHVIYSYRWLGDDIVKSENVSLDDENDDEDNPEEGKKVKLAGGCELTENQYLELESFKKETEYVKKCYCENGGVYCQINKALFKNKKL